MVTKKQHNTTPQIVLSCMDALQTAHTHPKYKGKSETNGCKDFEYPNAVKVIVISYEKFKFTYPMNEEEYKIFKKLEADWWHNERR